METYLTEIILLHESIMKLLNEELTPAPSNKVATGSLHKTGFDSLLANKYSDRLKPWVYVCGSSQSSRS